MCNVIKSYVNNNKVSSIKEFCNIDSKIINNSKNTTFIRLVGFDEPTRYINEIKEMDSILNNNNGGYLRLSEFPKAMDTLQTQYYSERYDIWVKNERKSLSLKNNILDIRLMNTFNAQLINIENVFSKNKSVSQSICRNFIIKIMYWIDNIVNELFKDINNNFMGKMVVECNVKRQEYLFLYFLANIGIDVMLLLPECDLQIDEELKIYSLRVKMSNSGKILLPKYERTTDSFKTLSSNLINNQKSSIVLPPRPAQNPPRNMYNKFEQNSSFNQVQQLSSHQNISKQELSFEELAQLASSVVMIGVHNKKGEAVSSGSGIIISEEGYILTNFHVIQGGAFYSVRIENDNNIYKTDNVIKYHNVFDLAVIRIDRKCNYLKMYNQPKPLVRGQKVVAIGSPLGLFNSVSDGIISGFRNINMMDMIQFTAPISNGSSGGAVLNMYGEVIGISTAGIDEGQNINLAVDYKVINNFIKGFVP